jgi:signal peptidase I
MQNDTITHTPGPDHAAPAHHHPAKPPKESWRSILSTVLLIAAIPLTAILLMTFVFRSYEVEGPSMEQTLQNKDRLIVLKLGKTWADLFNNQFTPKRGEIVIFHRPENAGPATTGEKQLIKRVIALPGERVELRDGTLTVFNNEHPDGFWPDSEGKYKINGDSTPGEGSWTLGDDEVFVAGDNRFNSLDSRSFGPIKTKEIVGNLALRIFPFNKFDTF